MRLFLILILFAPSLAALDMKQVDGDTLRYARLALLKDAVRKHFELKIGDFESLDQAVRVKIKMGDAEQIVILRLKEKAAAVLICDSKEGDAAGAYCFLEVESRIDVESVLTGEFVVVRCSTSDQPKPVRSRLLRFKNDKLLTCLSWLSSESESWNDGRYVKNTNRRLRRPGTELQLLTSVEYLLDNKPVDGGQCEATTPLLDKAGSLERGQSREDAISLTSHCALARKLEREGLNAAALHHATLANQRANSEQLPEDDTRRLEAMALVARLEARLRRTDLVER